MSALEEVLIRLFTLVVAFTVHELAHAAAAVALGDDTPRYQGRLTLNPLAHLDPWGTLLFLLSGFGWAKPVPVNPYRLRHRYGMSLVAAAGPASNLLLALAAAAVAHLLPAWGSRIAFGFVWLNLVLCFFNLLPLPPLDGSRILADLAPNFWHTYIAPLEPYAPAVFLVVVFLLPMLRLDVLFWLVVVPARLLMGWLF